MMLMLFMSAISVVYLELLLLLLGALQEEHDIFFNEIIAQNLISSRSLLRVNVEH